MSTGWSTEEATPAQPGRVFPIRRMTLGEVLGGGFSMLRHSPKAVLGVPFVAGMVSFLLSMVMFLVFPMGDFMRLAYSPMAFEDEELLFSTFFSPDFWVGIAVLSVIQYFVLAVAFSLMVLPTLRAAYGYRTGFVQALRLRAGRIGWLVLHVLVLSISLGVLFVLVMILVVVIVMVTFGLGLLLVLPGMLLLTAWLTAGLMYAPLVVLVERRGPLGAIARSWRLNRGRWWVNIGTVALIYLMMFVMLMIASMPMGILSLVGGEMAVASPDGGAGISMVLVVLASFFDSVLSAVFLGLVGALVSVMYLNCRIHQESVDVALLTAADGAFDDGAVVPASVEHLGEPTVAAPGWGGPQSGPPGWGGQPPYGQNPYGQPPQSPYGQSPYGNGPHGQPPQNPYGQNPYGNDPYGRPPQNPYGQNPYGQNPYGQQPGHGPEGQGPNFGQPR